MPDDPPEKLDDYRRKRAPDRTPEPFGGTAPRDGGAALRPRLFVVHKHGARRLHWDLRLEHEGALVSWACPKGPSLDPKEKRLCVAVEDHPLAYADFEGSIPEKAYGAGPVIVWDKGAWIPLADPAAGLAQGKLDFELRGYKLRGRFALVRTKRDPKGWLLLKKQDGFARSDRLDPGQESVLSGLTLEEVSQPGARADALRAELARLGAEARSVRAEDVTLMLAETAEKPFSHPGWFFELKWDGFRMLAAREGHAARLLYRSGLDATATFPEISRALATLPYAGLVLDGEIAVLEDDGRARFARLQQRLRPGRPDDALLAEHPVTFLAFDLLAAEGFDLRPLPLATRKQLLRRVLPRHGPLRYVDHVEEQGAELFEKVVALNIEGVMAKRASAPYRPGRSGDWLKVRARKTTDLVVVGYSPQRELSDGLGALHLARRDEDGQLVYAGRAGSGIGGRESAELQARLDQAPAEKAPCLGAPARPAAGTRWVEPRVVVELRYLEWTKSGTLREPIFLRIRDDKRPEDVTPEAPAVASEREAPAPAPIPTPVAKETNRPKPFFPEDRLTKGDVLDYYRAVAPWLLPWLQDRPVTLTRYPDGIHGKSFYQHDAPLAVPDWIRTERTYSHSSGREIAHFIPENVESLVYLANLGAILLHVWSSRCADLGRPDFCTIDLDPGEATFQDAVRAALLVRDLCESVELPSFVKTSGGSGLHVLIPLGAACSHEDARNLAQLLARLVEREHPDLTTTTPRVAQRGKRVYLDMAPNGQGKLLVAPFSLRPLPGAPVSMPLRWEELGPDLDPKRFHLKNAIARLEAEGDPARAVLTVRPDLVRALGKLDERVRATGG